MVPEFEVRFSFNYSETDILKYINTSGIKINILTFLNIPFERFVRILMRYD